MPTSNVTSKHELGKPCAASAFWSSVAAALASESEGAGRAGVRAAGATRVACVARAAGEAGEAGASAARRSARAACSRRSLQTLCTLTPRFQQNLGRLVPGCRSIPVAICNFQK